MLVLQTNSRNVANVVPLNNSKSIVCSRKVYTTDEFLNTLTACMLVTTITFEHCSLSILLTAHQDSDGLTKT